MQQDPLKLLERYKAGNCSEEEKAIVETWYLQLSTHNTPGENDIEGTKNEVWKALTSQRRKNRRTVGLNFTIRVAAVLALVAVSVTLYFQSARPIQQKTGAIKNEKIIPGANKAYLTLANGKKISLTDAANGTIQQQMGLTISKTADGTLVYEVADSGNSDKHAKTMYNTIETPRGGQYQINLPDGTKVWLNAASSLKYPTQFSGSERIVELSGEGYFEVAKRKHQQFVVKTGNQQVEVLGTHFNINAYKDEGSIKTTLLEGAVRLSLGTGKNEQSRLLSPGQQGEQTGGNIDVKSIDTENVMAWKKGDFIFNGEELSGIMRKIERWYDVDVVYKGNFDDLKFGGYISRSKNILSVLDIMESTGKIHFKIQGKTITVLNTVK